jgi:hypothetical protein
LFPTNTRDLLELIQRFSTDPKRLDLSEAQFLRMNPHELEHYRPWERSHVSASPPKRTDLVEHRETPLASDKGVVETAQSLAPLASVGKPDKGNLAILRADGKVNPAIHSK